MPTLFQDFFASSAFMPHGHCYLWQPALLWLQVLTNLGIGLAYLAIFLTLVYLVYRIQDIPFQWMYVAFAVFIVTCGITHFFDVYVIWTPAYWTDGAVRLVTALASVGTAVLLPPLVPKAVALADAAKVSHERGIQLEAANRELGVLLEKTQELEQLKTQFFANISHELRTPLALILAPTEKLLASGELSQAQRRELEVVGRNAQTLLRHVNDLLDVSKLEAGKLTPAYVETDLSALVRLGASHFDGLARERGITFRLEVSPQVTAQVDPDKVSRAGLAAPGSGSPSSKTSSRFTAARSK
jgi:signal transduction histidine kinase